jgi:glycosyltransferase involved in cell wall biosynthesis
VRRFTPTNQGWFLVSLSVVVPIYNERDNIDLLHRSLTSALDPYGRPYELIFVNDGSRDGSSEKLEALARRDSRVKVVEFRRNYGQTAAMQAGIQHASHDYVVTIDGDLQNDPTDIPVMVAKLEEGYDLVHGWRKHRQDALVNRKLPSKLANWLISRVTGFPVHDLGCTLKVIRREIAQELQLYGEMHRFIPILAHWHGARCVEVETKHHPRRFGTTKYGIGRTLRVVLDLMTVQFLTKYSVSPMKLFGGLGFASLAGGIAAAVATVGMKIVGNVDMTGNPLLLASVLGTVVGMQFFVLGLLGEVCSRIYYACRGQTSYTVRRLVNFDETPALPTIAKRAA